MEGRSFKRAALFGVLGALIFLVTGVVLVAIFPRLGSTLVFETRPVTIDLQVIEVKFLFNLFVVIGFAVGWAVCLLRKL